MEEGASPPRWALDKKLGEDVSMEEKKGSERIRDLEYQTSRISSVGICGRKSLPTKKQENKIQHNIRNLMW